MKRFVFAFIAVLFLFLNCLPSSLIFADSGYTDSQFADIGTLMLTNLIASGEATELDFSDYTENQGLDFLISLGELAVSGDPTGLIDQGLTWLGGELSDAYDSVIESIREWEYSVAPDLYNWWYQGTQYEYKLQTANNISRPLLDLFTPPDDSAPTPSPDHNYETYIKKINDFGAYQFYWSTAPTSQVYGGRSGSLDRYVTPTNNWNKRSYFVWNTSGNMGYSYNFSNNGWNISNYMGCTESVLQLNINSINDSYTGIISNITAYPIWIDQYNTSWYAGRITYNNGVYSSTTVYRSGNDGISNKSLSYTGTLSEVFDYFANRVRNVNIYVDGNPWSIVDYVTPTYPIVIPDLLTVLNDLPAQYTYSEPTYIDLNNLKTLITNAINSSDILTWQDIDDYFVDVNGVTALPTIQIIRNDYDNMYLEQYPYPASLIGFNEPLKFNEHMLDNVSGQYLTPMVNVAQNTVNVLPSELKWVLGIGAILSIFALIINRLLE